MCQARTSVHFSSVLVWKLLSSLTFGFCSIWSLHFVAMLACELDLPIGIDVPLTILSSVLAVLFTFAAFAFDLLWETYRQGRWQRIESRRASASGINSVLRPKGFKSHSSFVEQEDGDISDDGQTSEHIGLLQEHSLGTGLITPPHTDSGSDPSLIYAHSTTNTDPVHKSSVYSPSLLTPDTPRLSNDVSESRRSSFMGSTHSSHGLASIMNLAHRSTSPAKNAFVVTGEALYSGCTRRHIVKAFSWSLAVSGMHYVGIAALRIPEGHFTLNPFLVVVSCVLSWVVCLIGIILMSRIETHLAQQFLFSVVASVGVAAMHFTGRRA